MSLADTLTARAGGVCELCGASEGLTVVEVRPDADGTAEMAALLCPVCAGQVAGGEADTGHWQCLSTSMWSEHAPVQVLAWRMLDRLKGESWARDLLDMLYLDEERLDWAKAGQAQVPDVVHRDSNGAVLASGDTVVLIKDLPVKGGGFTAKRGTAVRGISLVLDNAEHIEGRVEGQRIVILTQFVKKK